MMSLMWCTYVDDYPTVEFEITAEQGLKAKHLFLELLGWQYADEPSKCKAYAVSFKVLGAVLDLSAFQEGKAVIGNYPARVEKS
eukprot:6487422-Amphidinium_carterae.1